MHILFLACTERIASMLVPYWFSLYSPCSMNLKEKQQQRQNVRRTRVARRHRVGALSRRIQTYLLFKASTSNCCLVTKWYSTPSFS